MASNTINIGSGDGVVGMFFYGATSVTLPEDISGITEAALTAAGLTEVGEVSSDGISISNNGSKEELKNWAGATRRVVFTDPGYEVSVPVISSTADSFEAIFGSDIVTTAVANGSHGNTIKVTLDGQNHSGEQAFLLLGKDGDDHFIIGIPDGTVTVEDEISFVDGELVTWPAKIVTGKGGMFIVKDDGQVESS